MEFVGEQQVQRPIKQVSPAWQASGCAWRAGRIAEDRRWRNRILPGRNLPVLKTIITKALLPCVAIALISAGCQQKASQVPASSDLAVTPVSAATPTTPTYTPAPVPSSTAQPVTYDSNSATPTVTPGTPGAPASGSTYVVKPGDTLYGIARRLYGDGKQWQRIAAANPGLSPQMLKVGQTINLP
jgi:5'-nucleotidase